MALYQNGYLVFTINGHSFKYDLLLVITNHNKRNILQGKKNILTRYESWMAKRKKPTTRKRMTVYCQV